MQSLPRSLGDVCIEHLETQKNSMSEITSFDYVNLSEVDPSFKPIPEAFYNLKVIKAEKREFTYKQDVVNKRTGEMSAQAGDIGQLINFQFAVCDDAQYSGRRVFDTLFFGERELKQLRKLSEVAGVQQQPGESFADWLTRFNETQPIARTLVTQVPDRRDPQVMVNRIAWKELIPAS